MAMARSVYEKVLSGDPLTNTELKFGVEFFEKLADDLRQCGPVFQLASKEANRVHSVLYSFQEARKRK